MAAEGIDLKGKVVAVFDTLEATDGAVGDLREGGFEVEVLRGEEGRRRLDPHTEEEGILQSFEHALETILGDEDRILDEVDSHLAEERSFVVVDIGEDGESAADILKRHGGHYMWRFGKWTYVPVGGH